MNEALCQTLIQIVSFKHRNKSQGYVYYHFTDPVTKTQGHTSSQSVEGPELKPGLD